jgi:hypothetical protein
VTSADASFPAIDQPLGEMPQAIMELEEKRPRGQQVLNGLPGVRVRGGAKTLSAMSDMASFENGV